MFKCAFIDKTKKNIFMRICLSFFEYKVAMTLRLSKYQSFNDFSILVAAYTCQYRKLLTEIVFIYNLSFSFNTIKLFLVFVYLSH